MKVCSKCKIEKPFTNFHKHAAKADGFRSNCKACTSKNRVDNHEKFAARDADYRAKNPDKVSESKSAYYSANREKVIARSAACQAKNPAKYAEHKAAYRAANRKKIAEMAAKYRAANRERIAAQGAKYRAENPDKISEYNRNRSARKRNAEGIHAAADVRAIFEKQQGLCSNCQTKLFKSGKQRFHVDHIMPLALGGSNWPCNLQCLCPFCNLSKGAKHPGEWAKQQGKLL